MASSFPGKLIVFEGGDGSGKTTQLNKLEYYLWIWLRELRVKNKFPYSKIVATRQPGATELGQEIRHLLLHGTSPVAPLAELLLYAADRAQHVQAVVLPALQAGAIVLCDRWTHSTVAYQGYGRGLDLQAIAHLNAIACAGVEPDLTLWFDLPSKTARLRVVGDDRPQDRIEQEELSFWQKVEAGYRELAKAPNVTRINAEKDRDTIAEYVRWRSMEMLLEGMESVVQ